MAADATSTISTHFRSAAEVRAIVDRVNLGDVARHFRIDPNGDDDLDDDELVDIDPFSVCDGVSIDVFNEYIGDGEGLRVSLRFLCLSDNGEILIVELPTAVHEITARKFENEFMAATGNHREIGSRGSMTASSAGRPNKEADATFGPKGSTPNRSRPPPPRAVLDWVTLAVEVGRTQTCASLEAAAAWWFDYTGIQYVLLLKIAASGRQIKYALYDRAQGPMPVQTLWQTIRPAARGRRAVLAFDMRRILSIPANQALPNGVNPIAEVNLRIMMDQVIDTIG